MDIFIVCIDLEAAVQEEELICQNIYSRRWNRSTWHQRTTRRRLHEIGQESDEERVNNSSKAMLFCRVHRLGRNISKPRQELHAAQIAIFSGDKDMP